MTLGPTTRRTREVWANVRDEGVAHRVLAEQLLTGQAAACGWQPADGDSWMWTEGSAPRPTVGRCKRCLARPEAT